MAKVIVSACLLGERCKYSGGNNACPCLIDMLSDLSERCDIEIIPVCPEVAGGLSTPRPPAEIVRDDACTGLSGTCEERVLTRDATDVTASFHAGVAAETERVRAAIESGEPICAILQSRSPSCGVHEVYDGTFTGKLIPGMGLFARALSNAGVRVIDVRDEHAWRGVLE